MEYGDGLPHHMRDPVHPFRQQQHLHGGWNFSILIHTDIKTNKCMQNDLLSSKSMILPSRTG